MIPDWLLLLSIVLLLGGSAFLSGSESALTASSRARLLFLERKGGRGARLAGRLLGDRDRVIGAILIGNNLFNTLATALAAGFLVVRLGDEGILLATILMTVLISFFSEVLPKFYALQEPERTMRRVAPVLRVFTLLLRPFVFVIYGLAELFLRAAFRRGARERREAREEELRGAIEVHGEAEERRMLRSVLDMREDSISEVMVHRSEVVSVPGDLRGAELLERVLSIPHSRIPVWRDHQENIVGILYVKDLFRASRSAEKFDERADALARPAWFSPDSTSVSAQLRTFRRRREHISVVVDEYGEMMGLVTLEDILEEIVGEIFDEEDEAGGMVAEVRGDVVIAAGGVSVRDLNREFGWRLPDGDASTLGGLVLYAAERIPEAGEVVEAEGFSFRVLELSGRTIVRVEIRPPDSEPE
ncbi:MAG: CNNM domain-containing protein [Alphaproteobacteria bacterium]|nr:CNNM domain-containing protein [Alphaproteobacteria bacterium]